MKKKDILSFVTTQLDLEGIMLTEVNWEDKYYKVTITCGVEKEVKDSQEQRNSKVVARVWRLGEIGKIGKGTNFQL